MLFLWESTRKSLANDEITNDFNRFSRRSDVFTSDGARPNRYVEIDGCESLRVV